MKSNIGGDLMIMIFAILAGILFSAFLCVVYGMIIITAIVENYNMTHFFLDVEISLVEIGLVGFVVLSSVSSTIYFVVKAATALLKKMNEIHEVDKDIDSWRN